VSFQDIGSIIAPLQWTRACTLHISAVPDLFAAHTLRTRLALPPHTFSAAILQDCSAASAITSDGHRQAALNGMFSTVGASESRASLAICREISSGAAQPHASHFVSVRRVPPPLTVACCARCLGSRHLCIAYRKQSAAFAAQRIKQNVWRERRSGNISSSAYRFLQRACFEKAYQWR